MGWNESGQKKQYSIGFLKGKGNCCAKKCNFGTGLHNHPFSKNSHVKTVIVIKKCHKYVRWQIASRFFRRLKIENRFRIALTIETVSKSSNLASYQLKVFLKLCSRNSILSGVSVFPHLFHNESEKILEIMQCLPNIISFCFVCSLDLRVSIVLLPTQTSKYFHFCSNSAWVKWETLGTFLEGGLISRSLMLGMGETITVRERDLS